MTEAVFLNEGKLFVDRSTIRIDGHSFAVRNITSVRVAKQNHPRWMAVLMILSALVALSAAISSKDGYGPAAFFSVAAFAFGWFHWHWKPTLTLVLVAGGSEQKTLQTKDAAGMARVLGAVEAAMAAR